MLLVLHPHPVSTVSVGLRPHTYDPPTSKMDGRTWAVLAHVQNETVWFGSHYLLPDQWTWVLLPKPTLSTSVIPTSPPHPNPGPPPLVNTGPRPNLPPGLCSCCCSSCFSQPPAAHGGGQNRGAACLCDRLQTVLHSTIIS